MHVQCKQSQYMPPDRMMHQSTERSEAVAPDVALDGVCHADHSEAVASDQKDFSVSQPSTMQLELL